MITQSTWVRDTLIRIDVFNSLPAERQTAINTLHNEYVHSGYIDARTELGPDQYARMSKKRLNEISATASRVFRIEQEIKLLMRSDAQIVADDHSEQDRIKAEQVRQLQHRLHTIEQFCSRRLNSSRNNSTKQEYQEVKTALAKLQPAV